MMKTPKSRDPIRKSGRKQPENKGTNQKIKAKNRKSGETIQESGKTNRKPWETT